MTRHAIRVECPLPLPLASTVAAAVRGDNGMIEGTDGLDWTDPVITSPSHPGQRVDITTATSDPRMVDVASADRALARTAAMHIAMETHGRFL